MNRIRFASALAGAVLSLGAVSLAQAQVINDGDSSMNVPAAGTTGATVRTGATGNAAGTLVAGGDTTDQLFQQWWWYRVNGTNAREFGFSNRTSNLASGNTLTLDYTEPEGFSARIVYALTDGTNSPASCNVAASLTLTNNNAGDLSIAVFNYLDFDLEGAAGDSATLLGPGRVQITDGTTAFAGQFLGVNPDAYQVTAFVTLRNTLTDADIDNLNNSGLPFNNADFTGAMQWNLIIPPGASRTIRSAFSLNMTADAGGDTCVGDTDGDGDRDLTDLAVLLTNFGVASGAGPEDGDTDGDGDVDLTDLATLLTVFGSSC